MGVSEARPYHGVSIMGSRKCSEVNAATLQKTFVIMAVMRLDSGSKCSVDLLYLERRPTEQG
jgi:hypothetical protein